MNTTSKPALADLKALEKVPDLYLILSPELDVLTASDAFLQVTNTQRSLLKGQPALTVLQQVYPYNSSGQLPALAQSLHQVLVSKKPQELPEVLVMPDTSELTDNPENRYWRFRNIPITDAHGNILYIIHKAEDVTQLQQALTALRNEHQHFNDAQRIGRIGSFERVLPGETVSWSDELFRIHGLEPKPGFVPIEYFLSFVHPDDLQQTLDAIKETHATGKPFDFTHRITRADGQIRYVQRRAQLIKDAQGKPVKVYGTLQDITDQVQAEKEMLRLKDELTLNATDKYKKIINSLDEGFCVLDVIFNDEMECVDFRYIEINDVFEKQVGVSNVLGKTINELVPDIELCWKRTYGQVALTGEPIRFESYLGYLDKWFDLYAFRINEFEKNHVAVLFKDVTQRRKDEQQLNELNENLERLVEARTAELRESQLLTEQVMEATPDFIMVFNLLTNKVEYVNQDAYKDDLTRYQETLRIDYDSMLDRAHPDDRDKVKTFVNNFRTVADNEIYTLDYRVIKDDSTTWYRSRGKVFKRDNAGNPTHYISVVQDISKVKQLEQENLQMKLDLQKSTLIAILEAQEVERRRISESLHNGVGQLLYAAQLNLDRLQPATAPVSALKQAKELLSEAIYQTRKVSHELVPALLLEFGLDKALHDLCTMYDESALYISCSTEGIEERLESYIEIAIYRICQELINNIVKHAEASVAAIQVRNLKHKIILQVRDNGKGFDPENIRSRGIGLQMIEDRVKLLNGTFSITSPKTGKGSLVTIQIPLS